MSYPFAAKQVESSVSHLYLCRMVHDNSLYATHSFHFFRSRAEQQQHEKKKFL